MTEIRIPFEKSHGGKGHKSNFRLALEALEVDGELIAEGRTAENVSPIFHQLRKKDAKRFKVSSKTGALYVKRVA